MQYKIAVSGSAENNCAPGAFKKAYEVGRQVALQGAVLLTGATIGVPAWATRGAKSVGGISIGLSPAVSRSAHVNTYHLPTAYMDLIIYTGFDYSGRNMLMTRAADAVIVVCGRIGTINEFTTAFEEKRIIGVLTGTGGTETEIDDILKAAKRGRRNIVFESEPKKLVQKVLKLVRLHDRHKKEVERHKEVA
ncbi:MAG: LOG family protein [Candidatus Doudnabacteria bacterium]|nr:LOG family protein [Candidatus Doudnabacteria bacterium]